MPIPTPLIFLILLIIVLGIIGSFLKSAAFKGWVGERRVSGVLRRRLDPKTYFLISNITLPSEGGTTQIDHVAVSIYGIFVIETKNLTGWIFGSERESTWTQKLFKKSVKFQNPLRQNYKHTKTLAELLDLPENCLKSVVVFSGDATFKKEMPPNVLKLGDLAAHIKQHVEPVLTEEQVAGILAVMEEKRLAPGLRTRREHIRNVRGIIEKKTSASPARATRR